MKIEVIRAPGDIPAPAIINALCTQDAAGIECGRNFLDENGFNKAIYDITMPYRTLPSVGAIVQVSDSALGQVFYAKIISFSHSVAAQTEATPPVVSTRITVERSFLADEELSY